MGGWGRSSRGRGYMYTYDSSQHCTAETNTTLKQLCFSECMCGQSLQSCPTLCNPVDCSPPGFSVHGILQARILEWVAIPFSRGSSRPRDQTQVYCTAGRFSAVWATEAVLNQEAAFHFEVSSTEEYILCLWSASLGLITGRLCIAYVSDCHPLRSIKEGPAGRYTSCLGS